jgi:YgiT-type zinc finger domain-containing protein
MKATRHTYSDCFYCGGIVTERILTKEYHKRGKLLLIENVPVGVCEQCGERFLLAAVAKRLERIVAKGKRVAPRKTVNIPVLSYTVK